MKKDFQKWHELKSKLQQRKRERYFHVRDIWFCHIGLNLGFEQDGKNQSYERPVVVLRKFNNDICLVVPLTSTQKKGEYYHTFSFLDKDSTAILSQIRLVDKKRLIRKIAIMNKKDFGVLREKIKEMI